MGGVDNSHYSLVAAAAQAAGPCPPGGEAVWGRRVHGLAVDLHLIAQQARQDIERLESARTFIAFLEKVEIEESSRRGLLTLRLPSGESEPIRTEQKDTDRGQALIERARSLPRRGARRRVTGSVGSLAAGARSRRGQDHRRSVRPSMASRGSWTANHCSAK
jgi:hypothetical protein